MQASQGATKMRLGEQARSAAVAAQAAAEAGRSQAEEACRQEVARVKQCCEEKEQAYLEALAEAQQAKQQAEQLQQQIVQVLHGYLY